MGTRGLKIILFRGRYFVYYISQDSYPEGLGRNIVNRIPTDQGKYKEWLEKERAVYTKIIEKLESELNKIIVVSEDSMRELLEDETNGDICYGPTWGQIDCDVCVLPTTLCNVGNDLFHEWVYLIDLDNERFSVDNWIFFDLWNIPRDLWLRKHESEEEECSRSLNQCWIQAFTWDDEKKFSRQICPEGSVGIRMPLEYFGNSGAADSERDRCCASYQQYSHLSVEANSRVMFSSKAALQQTIMIMLFEKFTRSDCFTGRNSSYNRRHIHDLHFWDYIPGLSHENFAFREVAFVILSFAAGQLYFDEPHRFYGDHKQQKSSGYLIDRNEGGKPKLMPVFGFGCHSPDQEPGSAPSGSLYWFENVLISLVPDTAFERDTEAMIAKAVEHGIADGKTCFQVVIFSIFHAIMLEVDARDNAVTIRRTGLVSICKPRKRRDDDRDNGEENLDASDAADPIQHSFRKHSGFVSLQNFFNAATNRHLSVFSNGCFPTEIYAKIIASADCSTRIACAKVSLTFHALCQERFSFSENRTILKFEVDTFPYRPDLPLWKDLGMCTFQNRNTGCITRERLSARDWQILKSSRETATVWCPVVGGVARPSMITQFELRLSPEI